MTESLRRDASFDTARSREFSRAHRHSRRVRLLKFGLPSVALLMVLAGAGVVLFARSLPVDFAFAATALEGGRLVMDAPRMSGNDANDRPYSIHARRAIQSLTGGGVDLEGIRANVGVDERTDATILATGGHYDTDAERLRLFGDIEVDTTSGISIRLPEAEIDMASGRLEGSGPVTITMPNQRLQSGSLVVEDGGAKLSFRERVKLTLLPSGGSQDGETAP